MGCAGGENRNLVYAYPELWQLGLWHVFATCALITGHPLPVARLSQVRVVDHGQMPVAYASLHIMARLLSQPHKLIVQRNVSRGKSRGLDWTWEDVPLYISKFLIRKHHDISWTEEALIKVRCVPHLLEMLLL